MKNAPASRLLYWQLGQKLHIGQAGLDDVRWLQCKLMTKFDSIYGSGGDNDSNTSLCYCC